MKNLVLVTGAAGFIGFRASHKLIAEGFQVIGIDNLNDYYNPALKQARLDDLKTLPNFKFFKADICDSASIKAAVGDRQLDYILHLAAQAGVRYSLENPRAYVDTNLVGHLNMLELARHTPDLKHFVYASSSSVYGDRADGPFKETDVVRRPASLYAATKIGGEMLAESYRSLYGINQTGLRFFTVYGPWGRPDMAYYIFTQKILRGEPIQLFAPDAISRDLTYIDDITNTLPAILRTPPKEGHAIYNLGNHAPNSLMELVETVERACARKAEKQIMARQKGDVGRTFADIDAASRDFGFNPATSLESGITHFVEWYKASGMKIPAS